MTEAFRKSGHRNDETVNCFAELKEEIFIVDNETDVLINYVSVMQYPLFSLFSMTNGPITKSKFGNNDDEESYMS